MMVTDLALITSSSLVIGALMITCPLLVSFSARSYLLLLLVLLALLPWLLSSLLRSPIAKPLS